MFTPLYRIWRWLNYRTSSGLDFGGMSREWVWALTEAFFDPKRHLFTTHSKGYYYLIDKVDSLILSPETLRSDSSS